MASESQELGLAWLQKAKSDLDTARILIFGEERHLDTGVYHCQQAGEKALKAWLTYKEIPFAKTHDLEVLEALCEERDEEFRRFAADSSMLTPYATEFRYPGDIWEPAREDAEHAFTAAKKLMELVEGKLPQR